ncbi:hypothetical protein [Metaclostridioides mangenotii]|uniref:hypothetical protein n=1 Tax=Metaclostridioides mangenotii TaxID=1540 RepID=UPI0028EF9B0E|nr:hypothetical protein [Clostridioides mangenotii]
MEDKDRKISDLVDEILETKFEINSRQEDLENSKAELVDLMDEKNVDKVICDLGTASIVSFNRQSLIKGEVLNTFAGVNAGEVKSINAIEHIKISPVRFVLVKPLEEE